MHNIQTIRSITSHITFSVLGQKMWLIAEEDKRCKDPEKRVYLRVFWHAFSEKEGRITEQKGGKHYLSFFSTEDEVVKKAYAAFNSAVHFEIMKGFRFDGVIVFNPEVDFRKLMEVSPHEITREHVENFDV